MTKKGEKKYGRWMAGWREGGKLAYVGPCRKMSRAEALQMAREMKAEALAKVGREAVSIVLKGEQFSEL